MYDMYFTNAASFSSPRIGGRPSLAFTSTLPFNLSDQVIRGTLYILAAVLIAKSCLLTASMALRISSSDHSLLISVFKVMF